MRKAALLGATLAAGLTLISALSGCYSTSGGIMSRTGGGFTYISTSAQPTTVTVVNSCERSELHPDGTPFFIMEIPPGKQLTFNFEETGGDDPAARPATMMYAVWEAPTGNGSLDSILSCAPAACRRIDVTYRRAPEAARPDESYRLVITDGQPITSEAQPRAPRPGRNLPDH